MTTLTDHDDEIRQRHHAALVLNYVMDAWGRQGWILSDRERRLGIAALTKQPSYSEAGNLTDAGGRYQDISERASRIAELLATNLREEAAMVGPREEEEALRSRLLAEALHRECIFLSAESREELANDLLRAAAR